MVVDDLSPVASPVAPDGWTIVSEAGTGRPYYVSWELGLTSWAEPFYDAEERQWYALRCSDTPLTAAHFCTALETTAGPQPCRRGLALRAANVRFSFDAVSRTSRWLIEQTDLPQHVPDTTQMR